MLSGQLWSAHPHPYPGECLSSWIVRTAHHNGLKIQTFGRFALDKRYELWNRDIDRFAPDNLLTQMANKTGTKRERVNKTTLKLFEGRLFPNKSLSGVLRWITPLKLKHRFFSGFGMQFCPLCLMEDSEAYYRISWRVAFYTFCPKHMTMMLDRCSHCGAAVAFHRLELGRQHLLDAADLSLCWKCENSLAECLGNPVDVWHKNVFRRWQWKLAVIDRGFVDSGPVNPLRLTLLHQLCRIIASPSLAPELQRYLCDKTGRYYRSLNHGRIAFEQRSIDERHYILELAWWLIEKYPRKIKEAIRHNVLRNNDLYRDVESELRAQIAQTINCVNSTLS